MAIVIAIVSYLIGSIPVGVLVGRARGFDPRGVGSGNVGMTNVARAGGRNAAAITFAGDMLKGLIPVLIARGAGLSARWIAISALAAFLGALYSVFIRFEGGKGGAAGLGVWLGLSPMTLGAPVVVFAILVAARRIVSLASLGAAIVLPISAVAMRLPRSYVAAAILMSALVFWRHRSNIQRLISGQESRIDSRGGGSETVG